MSENVGNLSLVYAYSAFSLSRVENRFGVFVSCRQRNKNCDLVSSSLFVIFLKFRLLRNNWLFPRSIDQRKILGIVMFLQVLLALYARYLPFKTRGGIALRNFHVLIPLG